MTMKMPTRVMLLVKISVLSMLGMLWTEGCCYHYDYGYELKCPDGKIYETCAACDGYPDAVLDRPRTDLGVFGGGCSRTMTGYCSNGFAEKLYCPQNGQNVSSCRADCPAYPVIELPSSCVKLDYDPPVNGAPASQLEPVVAKADAAKVETIVESGGGATLVKDGATNPDVKQLSDAEVHGAPAASTTTTTTSAVTTTTTTTTTTTVPLTFAGATHSETQCVADGGTVFDTGATGTLCRFLGTPGSANCPAGWSAAGTWGRYSTNDEYNVNNASTYKICAGSILVHPSSGAFTDTHTTLTMLAGNGAHGGTCGVATRCPSSMEHQDATFYRCWGTPIVPRAFNPGEADLMEIGCM